MDLAKIISLEEELRRIQEEERHARQMTVALVNARAPEKDVGYAQQREIALGRKKRSILIQLQRGKETLS